MKKHKNIEHIVKNADAKLAHCFVNGIYHYRSIEKDGKQYCTLNADKCPYYKAVKNHEYCTRYSK